MDEVENFPSHIGRYEIKAQLGAGAMGCVYLAEDPRIKRKLAIKVVKVDAMRSEADRKEFLARFQREAEVSGVLNNPGIVTIYDVGDSEVGPFLAMEFVPGKTLEGHIKGGTPLPLRTKLSLASDIAAALDHAHAHDVIHRDVKPGNVMVTADFKAKLMDFGIAKREDASLTQTGTFLGTPSYASPEQIKDGVATAQSDVFSFGVMVFELLSGSLPFPGTSINTILYKIVNEPPAQIQPPVDGLMAEGWQRVFNKVLAKNAKDRHPSCSAFVRDLLESTTDLGKTERMQLLGNLKPPPAGAEGEATHAEPVPAAATTVISTTDLVQPAAAKPNKTLLYAGGAAAAVVVLVAGSLLMRKGGTQVLLDSVPPQAAVIQAGKEVGKTPMALVLQAGDKVHLERKGFQPQDYLYKAGDTAPKVALVSVKSEETLRTEPAGATVVMDGVPLAGVTPLRVKNWDQGATHAVNFKKGSLAANFDLLEGETPGNQVYTLAGATEARSVAMPKTVDANAPGSLHFNGEYAVHVHLDGKDLGEIHPGGAVPAPPGNHHLELSAPGVYFKEARQVTVSPGRPLAVALPGLVHLTVETYPSDGLVVVDGSPTQVESDGSAPVTLTRGRHTISIQGHGGSARSVDLQGDTTLPRFKI